MQTTINDPDLAIVGQIKQGNTKLFDSLVIKYQTRVYRLVLRFIKNESESDEVTQEVFIRAYQSIAKFRGDSAFYTWLYRIAVNTAKNYLSAKKRQPECVSYTDDNSDLTLETIGFQIDNPENTLSGKQTAEIVDVILSKLAKELRDALLMREIEGLSYERIAEIMDCPIGTVRSRIARAREAVVQYLH